MMIDNLSKETKSWADREVKPPPGRRCSINPSLDSRYITVHLGNRESALTPKVSRISGRKIQKLLGGRSQSAADGMSGGNLPVYQVNS